MINDILKNKTCFLTGASGGLGKTIAMKMAENGCNLFLTSAKPSKLRELAELLQSLYGNKRKVACASGDLNRVADIKNIINKTRKEFGHVDIVVNCAGVFPVLSLANSKLTDLQGCFNVNVRAAFLFCQEFHKDMVRNKWGRIINIGSSSAYSGAKDTSIYCATKHALLGFSRALNAELKEYNIRTFCVSPGSVRTEMGKLVRNQNFETFIDPKEIAEYIIFISSFDGALISEEIRLNRMIMG